MSCYAIIMAGGGGKRLWPLSRQSKPKQFLDLLGNGTFLQNTISRLENVVPDDKIVVVGSSAHADLLQQNCGSKIKKENMLFEPIGRNTAPCIALAAVHVQQRSGDDAVMCILPADHFIADTEGFRAVLKQGIALAEGGDNIITLGITPTYPATSFGYIHADCKIAAESGVCKVKRFVEKPDAAAAAEYIKNGNYYWNGGMFIAKVGVIMEHLRLFLPELYASIFDIYAMFGSATEEEKEAAYSQLTAISIDYGVMEKSNRLLVIPSDFGWNDVGSYESIRRIAPSDEADNSVLHGRLIHRNSSGNLLYAGGKKPVVLSGVSDLVIVETDDVLYISKLEEGNDPSGIISSLAELGLEELE